ncbi:MaoC/PaaZ C-terminal domain-containing protein [Aquibacillus saliphilus]|uniref:MaoC/PaaZ C-terminal domain-containing protein n=1 Tax=Aquibacillus saliphilus TaxID=1909422 RepID=UPI001CEFC449|nr:MaoC/PaaZ C-terminal domain-containing protein [Aquibacillus saliphilus]
MLGKKRKIGKKINQLKIGESYQVSQKIEDKDLLLYLGLTNDANPLYIQHDYASQTPYKRPLVPSVMLFGMVSSVVSMHLPGPGSHIVQHQMSFPESVYHYDLVDFQIEITAIDYEKHQVNLSVIGTNQDEKEVIIGSLIVSPPFELESITTNTLNNF